MYIGTMTRYHCTSIRMAKIKKIVTTSNAGMDAKELGHSSIAGWNVKWNDNSGRVYGGFLQN